jgi:hypothetical protein
MSGATQKTAFVFAGGGSLGPVQVGMLRELIMQREFTRVIRARACARGMGYDGAPKAALNISVREG